MILLTRMNEKAGIVFTKVNTVFTRLDAAFPAVNPTFKTGKVNLTTVDRTFTPVNSTL
ncbi:hypothetical protein ACX0G7_18020 [Flavitalea antarctica]